MLLFVLLSLRTLFAVTPVATPLLPPPLREPKSLGVLGGAEGFPQQNPSRLLSSHLKSGLNFVNEG